MELTPHELLCRLAQERPIGSQTNERLLSLVEEMLSEAGFALRSLPFPCLLWERTGESFLTLAGERIPVLPSPFSAPFCGKGRIHAAKTLDALRACECRGELLLLSDELTREPLSPKGYPFYFPDEHRDLIALLEEKAPAAILAATGANPMSGENPFAFFEDGNFLIPSANFGAAELARVEAALNAGESEAALTIASRCVPAESRQLIARKSAKLQPARGRIAICAHLDTKSGTPGALDNAAGIAVLLKAAPLFAPQHYDLELVPINGEEHYCAGGELAYLGYLDGENPAFVVNIDSPCHIGSQTAFSFYNFEPALRELADALLAAEPALVEGEPWYAGDHAIFAFGGVPCAAVSSGDLFAGALAHTHTPADTTETVDPALIEPAARAVARLVEEFEARG